MSLCPEEFLLEDNLIGYNEKSNKGNASNNNKTSR